MTTLIEKLQVQKHELDQQLAAEQVKADLSDYSGLMKQRQALQAQADSDMAQLYSAKNEALAQVRAAQNALDTLAEESRKIGLEYQNSAPRWENKLAQVDQQIRALQPPALGKFVRWIECYHGALGGYTLPGSPFVGQSLTPTMATPATRDEPTRTVINRNALDRTIELLRTAKDAALTLGSTVEPGVFLEALDKLRADTEAELLALRTGQPLPKRGKSA